MLPRFLITIKKVEFLFVEHPMQRLVVHGMVEFSVTSTCMVYKICYLRTLDSKSIALTLGLPRGIFNSVLIFIHRCIQSRE